MNGMGAVALARDLLMWIAKQPRLRVEVIWDYLDWPPPPEERIDVRIPFGALIVRNVGGSDTQIVGVGFETEAGQIVGNLGDPAFPQGSQLPYTLRPHHRIDWTIIGGIELVDELRRQGYGGRVKLWGCVSLGNGKRVPSASAIEVHVPGHG